MKTSLFFAVIATLFSTHSLSHQDLPATPTGNEIIFSIIATPSDEGYIFLYSVVMHKDGEQAIDSSFVGYEETMEFMKTLRENEEEREERNKNGKQS